MKKCTLVAGIFDDASSAVDAIHELRRTSFSDDQLGFVVRSDTDEYNPNPLARCIVDSLPGGKVTDILFPSLSETGSEAGRAAEQSQATLLVEAKFQRTQKKGQIIVNCVIGGTLGAVATLQLCDIGLVIAGGTLAATLATVARGGMSIRLLQIGIPDHKIRYYEQQFLVGNIIFTVKAAAYPQEAQDILRYHRAYSVEAY
jgi:hypothetical protein